MNRSLVLLSFFSVVLLGSIFSSEDGYLLLDTSVFEKSITDKVSFFKESTGEKRYNRPLSVSFDADEGIFNGFIFNFSPDHSLEDIRKFINKEYSKSENQSFKNNPKMGIWKIKESGFSIILADNRSTIQVIYSYWKNSKKVDRLVDVMKSDEMKELIEKDNLLEVHEKAQEAVNGH